MKRASKLLPGGLAVAVSWLLSCAPPPPPQTTPAPGRVEVETPVEDTAPTAPKTEEASLGPVSLIMRTSDRLMVHGDVVRTVAVGPPHEGAPGGVVVGSSNHRVRFWDRRTGRHLRMVEVGDDPVNMLSRIDDERLVVATESSLILFDYAGQQLAEVKLPNSIQSLAVDTKRSEIAVGSHHDVHVVDAKTLKKLRSAPALEASSSIALSDGVVFARSYSELRMWRSGEEPVVFIGMEGSPRAMASRDGRLVACTDKHLQVWRHDGTELWKTPARGCKAIAFSRDGATIAAETKKAVTLFDTKTGVRSLDLDIGTHGVHALTFTGDGALVVGGYDHRIREFDLITAKERQPRDALGFDVRSVAISTASGLLFTAGYRGMFSWPIRRRGQRLEIKPTQSLGSGCVATNGKRYAVAAGAVEVFDMATRKRLHHLTDDHYGCHGLVFSKDGNKLVYVEDSTMRMFDLKNPTAPSIDWSAPGEMRDPVFTPDGKWLAVGVSEHGVQFLGAADLSPAFRIEDDSYVSGFALSDDATHVALTSYEKVRVWELDFAAQAATGPPTVIEHKARRMRAVRFAPGRPLLAYGDDTGKVRFWNYETKAEVASFEAHYGEVNALRFSGTWMATGGEDYTGALWETKKVE